ncbi:MAG: hypothetical protein ACT4PU_07225 [Planctomycetota bacterium]
MTHSLEDDLTVHGHPFLVGDRPQCFWEIAGRQENLRFLEGIDPGYFEYIAESLAADLEGEHSRRAALAMRSAYSHALEAFFALICAALQAPHCVAAWLMKYRQPDLLDVVGRIQEGHVGDVITQVPLAELSWEGVSRVVHAALSHQDKELEGRVKDGFGHLWGMLAADFLNEEVAGEYNSIKHGFRARSGGFSLAFGLEKSPGVLAPDAKMELFGASRYGSTYPVARPVGEDKANFTMRSVSRNWIPMGQAVALQLIEMSIANVVSALRIWNSVPPIDVKFSWPRDLRDFDKPWMTAMGVGSASFNPHIQDHEIQRQSSDMIRQVLTPPAVQVSPGWSEDVPRAPGWYECRLRGGRGPTEQFSLTGTVSLGLRVVPAEGGRLRPWVRLAVGNRREWREYAGVPEQAAWGRGRPVVPGWYVRRAAGATESQCWTVWRSPQGQIIGADRGGVLQPTVVGESDASAEWAAVVGRVE